MIVAADLRCPKCGAARKADLPSCARCGLVFEMWNPEVAGDSAAILDEQAETLWAAANATWDEASAHDAFLKYCSTVGLLPAAGRRYRERLDRNPTDAVAVRMQQRVVGMAMATLPPPRVKTSDPITRQKWFWWVCFGAIVLGVALAMLIRER